jgi:hypothetical protein
MKKINCILIIVAVFCLTSCQKDCQEKTPNNTAFCFKVYKPVCGCNNKTYGNSCEAEAFGITNYTQGACK